MSTLLIFLYKITIQLYGWGLKFAAPFHPKARLWVNGRKDLLNKLTLKLKENKAPIIWFHCASLGEFEQGRPIIESLKKRYPNYKILLTFFSPSGFEIRKNYPYADYITYLPLDTPKNARRFIEIARPKMAFFIKYEFWYFYLSILKKHTIPYYLIAGVLREDQLFFKPYGRWYLKVIEGFDQLFLQDQSSIQIANKFGLKNALLSGDPRVDRVAEIGAELVPIPKIETFKGTKQLMVLGSTHAKDEAIFFEFLREIKTRDYYNDWKFMLVPHEIDAGNLERIVNQSPIALTRYSTLGELSEEDPSILILDTIGQLSSAYQYGDLVYIGGGFDEGIHNILEPAVYGIPISFGSNYHKFKEAIELIKLGGVFEILTVNDLVIYFEKFQNQADRKVSGRINSQYIRTNKGVSKKIINHLINKNVL